MKIPRRPHPNTVPGERFVIKRDAEGRELSRQRSSVPMGTHKGAGSRVRQREDAARRDTSKTF